MKLSLQDITHIQNQYAKRRRQELRKSFAGTTPETEQRGQYFDTYIPFAESLSGSIESDHLMLLELGWLQKRPLNQCPQFEECISRGKWYGRRFWLADQLERLKTLINE